MGDQSARCKRKSKDSVTAWWPRCPRHELDTQRRDEKRLVAQWTASHGNIAIHEGGQCADGAAQGFDVLDGLQAACALFLTDALGQAKNRGAADDE